MYRILEQLEEYGYTLVEVDDKYFDCEGFDFNDDLTFNVEKYNARIQAEDDENKVANLQMKLDKTDYISNKLAEAITEYIVTGARKSYWDMCMSITIVFTVAQIVYMMM